MTGEEENEVSHFRTGFLACKKNDIIAVQPVLLEYGISNRMCFLIHESQGEIMVQGHYKEYAKYFGFTNKNKKIGYESKNESDERGDGQSWITSIR